MDTSPAAAPVDLATAYFKHGDVLPLDGQSKLLFDAAYTLHRELVESALAGRTEDGGNTKASLETAMEWARQRKRDQTGDQNAELEDNDNAAEALAEYRAKLTDPADRLVFDRHHMVVSIASSVMGGLQDDADKMDKKGSVAIGMMVTGLHMMGRLSSMTVLLCGLRGVMHDAIRRWVTERFPGHAIGGGEYGWNIDLKNGVVTSRRESEEKKPSTKEDDQVFGNPSAN